MPESFSVLDLYKKSCEYLESKGIKCYKSDTEWIFQEVLQIKKIDIFLDNVVIKNEQKIKLREVIKRRGKREPLQHIIGHVQFYNCTIKSDTRALIPRFETESLIELIVGKLPNDFNKKIFDLGTGTGAIIVSLAKQYPNSKCKGFDKSEDALSLAKENILINECSHNTNIEKFDWNKDVILEKCNVLVSNPPYLSLEEWEHTEIEVKEYDPKDALVSRNQGKSDLEAIIQLAPKMIVKGGILALEFGKGHGDYLTSKFGHQFANVEIRKDLNGVRRFFLGEI